MTADPIRLTAFSHGGGCGCKLSPGVLDRILRAAGPNPAFADLVVGNESRDDCAVVSLGDGRLLLSTTDFFLPIVDDPFTFGRIAATNAISDVYAMGGRPNVAIAILGWPVDKLAPEIAGQVVAGGRAACTEAGIPLAGGHSIDVPEPIFGLAVSGLVDEAHLKRNDGGRAGDVLFLTKPLGVGIYTTAEKRGLLGPADRDEVVASMVRLNRVGEELGTFGSVHALTDVTGFGLLGHLLEVCRGSGVGAELTAAAVPRFPHWKDYIDQGAVPGGTRRNWESYGADVEGDLGGGVRELLADPQTSGGLLVSVAPGDADRVAELLAQRGLEARAIGQLVGGEPRVRVG
jgi:selenide,water dikinase